jgi:hypothetical protein
MYFLVVEVHPKTTHPDYGTVDGAFAACFVHAMTPVEAERSARDVLNESGWDTEALEEAARWIDRAEIEGNAQSLERFDQASVDGIVVTLNRWPVGAPDED